ncbi:MAG: N-formylglutamate amidohydrolase, partial [Candidatus Magasanikbacteria bacterium]|nr:N-formylglutamate amidohydrolase [Candidatus Magasanikbacteria bacterium]
GAGGGGVVWKENLQGESIYNEGQEPMPEEMAKNVQDYYNPYYKGLHSLIGSLREKMGYGEILFLDAHSFPGNVDVPKIGLVGSEPKPIFILGSQGNTKASEEVMNWLLEALVRNAPSKENVPDLYENISEVAVADSRRGWGGFHNVEYFGQPDGIKDNIMGDVSDDDTEIDFKIHAVQLETNMSTFFNDGKYNKEYLEAMRQTIQKSLDEVGQKLKEKNKKV